MKERSIDFGDHCATVTQFTVLGDDEQTVEAIIVRLKIEGPQGFIRPRARSYALTAEEAVALGSALLAHGLDCQDRNEQLDHEAMASTDSKYDTPARHRHLHDTLAQNVEHPGGRLRIVQTPPPPPPLEGGVADVTNLSAGDTLYVCDLCGKPTADGTGHGHHADCPRATPPAPA